MEAYLIDVYRDYAQKHPFSQTYLKEAIAEHILYAIKFIASIDAARAALHLLFAPQISF